MPTIDIHERKLSNGLRVIACPNTSASVITVHVTYQVGSYDEHPTRTGLAHLFEHLMFDNTSTGKDKQYDTYCTKAGGTNNAYTTYDYTAYHITLPSHQLELGLWLEAERMRMFAIEQVDLSTQQSVVLEEIKQNVQNQPYMRWMPAMDAAAYAPNCHYSWNVYGSTEHVAAVNLDDARSFFHRYYNPGNAVLVVAGDCDPETVFTMAERLYGSIPSPSTQEPRTPFSPSDRAVGIHVIEKDSVPTAAVYASIHAPEITDPRVLDTDLVASLLGIGKSSVMYRQLVSKKRVASHAGAFVDRRTHDSLLTLFGFAIDASVSADKVYDEMQQAVANIKVTPEIMTKVVNRQRTALALELQRSDGLADSVAYHATFFSDPHEVNTLLDQYAARTIEDVTAMVDRVKRTNEWVRVDIVPRESPQT